MVRSFNALKQSRDFDSNGEYIKSWFPELAKLSLKHIHTPWTIPAAGTLNMAISKLILLQFRFQNTQTKELQKTKIGKKFGVYKVIERWQRWKL